MAWERLRNPRIQLAVILGGYFVCAGMVQVHCADLLTSDGQSYVRMAAAYARGDFRRAVFLNWSPLASLSAVPLVWCGMVPRHAFRVMIAVWGALAVVGVWRLAGRMSLGPPVRAAATACAAVMVAAFSAGHWVDLLLTALLLLYLDASMDDRLTVSWRRALGVGALGGLAYLGKNYGRPFFLAHFTLLVAVRVALSGPASGRLARATRTWALGMAGFALLALPWATVLSVRFGRVTFGTSVGQAYAKLGAASGDERQRAITGLRRPPDDAPNVWQDPSQPAPQAPGFTRSLWAGGWDAVKLQARTTVRNLGGVAGIVAGMDALRLGVAALALLPLVILATWRRDGASPYVELALALGVFCGGYALIYAREGRYFWLVFLVLTVLAFHFGEVLAHRMGRAMSERMQRFLLAGTVVVMATSLAAPSVRVIGVVLSRPPLGRHHRLLAARLADWDATGTLASVGERGWWHGLHVAYYLDAQYAGSPEAQDAAGIVREMRGAGAETLIVWDRPRLLAALATTPDVRLLGVVSAASLPGLPADAAVFRVGE